MELLRLDFLGEADLVFSVLRGEIGIEEPPLLFWGVSSSFSGSGSILVLCLKRFK